MIEIKEHSGKKYKVLNGTWYSIGTTDHMVRRLEDIRSRQVRVRFHWGEPKTGLDWGDEYDIKGTIGRSMGPVKVPLLIHSSRSSGGGGAILTDCIVKIAETSGGRVIYQHPEYKVKEAAA